LPGPERLHLSGMALSVLARSITFLKKGIADFKIMRENKARLTTSDSP
jgi:hypothetical protein